MPAKGSRVASRQSQINKRKKRQPIRKLSASQAMASTAVMDEPVLGEQTAVAEPAKNTARPSSRNFISSNGPVAYSYVSSEMIRIGIIGISVLIILGAISFVL
jgi:hypothetical protein